MHQPQRTNLGVDAAGTDNSTDVTLASVSLTDNYLTINNQEITTDASFNFTWRNRYKYSK